MVSKFIFNNYFTKEFFSVLIYNKDTDFESILTFRLTWICYRKSELRNKYNYLRRRYKRQRAAICPAEGALWKHGGGGELNRQLRTRGCGQQYDNDRARNIVRRLNAYHCSDDKIIRDRDGGVCGGSCDRRGQRQRRERHHHLQNGFRDVSAAV